VTVVSPIQEGASRALKPFRDLFGWVRDTVDAKGRLASVEKERDAYRREAIQGAAAVRENERLSGILKLDESLSVANAGPVTARNIGVDPSLWWSQITINKGSSAGVRVDQPVITGDGLVGRVSFVTPNSAIVTLITDHSTYVSARINETGVFGGVVAEAGRPDDLEMQYTTRNDRVDVGQTVVTAGTRSRSDRLRSLYPPNIPIGKVTRVDDPGTDEQLVHVRPFADMRRLEFVQVLTKAPNSNRAS
jgi:rod shape-determining protein MreC